MRISRKFLSVHTLSSTAVALQQLLSVFFFFFGFLLSRPYDGKWSKTMVGFGPEDDHFVAELTYNYGVGEYKLGNDFLVRL